MGFSVRIINDFEGLQALQDQWTDLLASVAHNRIFFTHHWFCSWWESFGEDKDLYVIAVYEDTALKAVAPFFRHTIKNYGLPIRKLELLANGYSEEAGIILLQGLEDALLDCIFGFLMKNKSEWDAIELKSMRDDPAHGAIAALDRNRLRHLVFPSKQITYIPIQGKWDELYAGRSKRFKKAFRARKNTISKHPQPVRMERSGEPEKLQELLQDVYTVSSRSWKVSNNKSLVNDHNAWNFLNNLVARLGPLGCIEIWMLYSADKPIAYEFHLLYGGITSPIRADFDEEFRKLSPGAYLEASILQLLFEADPRAITEYNTCADGYAYTLRWTDLTYGHTYIRVFAPTLYGKVLYLLSRFKQAFKGKDEKRLTSVRDR